LARLPVIVGVGGVNPAGRLSCHHAFRRLVVDRLPAAQADATWRSLAALMALDWDPASPEARAHMAAHTLVRRIEADHFDTEAIPVHRPAHLDGADGPLRFTLSRRRVPDPLPEGWQVTDSRDGRVTVTVPDGLDVLLPRTRVSRVRSAGQLPSGFRPDRLYPSRNHPRGLQLAVYGASDALGATGIDWETVRAAVRPDETATFGSSSMAQLDGNGYAGMMRSELLGKRVTSKQLPLGLPQMPADFVNAYVLGSLGMTGANIGACATFLYNLNQGVEEIRSGRRRVVMVGASEAPITPEVLEGYRTMGALAEDEALMALDGTDEADHRRACRPFAQNCGFTVSESAVFVLLMDDELAVELGAQVLGAVPGVFVHADGYKKSIPGPGVGNYLTMARALDLARGMLGDRALGRSFVHAHGTGTPQNRVTESAILSDMARTFGIDGWPVLAIKAYLGHSLAPASGDQLVASLGSWATGWLPGIVTIDRIADDVHQEGLAFSREHREIDPGSRDVAFVNSKGFGGNNATAAVLAPHVAQAMLRRRHGAEAWRRWEARNEAVREAVADYDARMCAEGVPPVYRFGEGVITGDELELARDGITIPGQKHRVPLNAVNPYPDMTGED
jgi:acetoacetyl-[acyl-carrier protein] synthase